MQWVRNIVALASDDFSGIYDAGKRHNQISDGSFNDALALDKMWSGIGKLSLYLILL